MLPRWQMWLATISLFTLMNGMIPMTTGVRTIVLISTQWGGVQKMERNWTHQTVSTSFDLLPISAYRMCSHDVTAAMLEEKTKKRRPSWSSEIFFWGLNSIFAQIPPFVSLCKYGFWSHERTHSLFPSVVALSSFFFSNTCFNFHVKMTRCILFNGSSICGTLEP